MPRRLGRLAPRPAHYEAGKHFVQLAPRHLASFLPLAPAAINLLSPWPRLYLGHNEAQGSDPGVGDCGPVGIANALSTQCLREGRKPAFADLPNVDDAIRALYLDYTGGQDIGVILLDFLMWLHERPDGFLGEPIGMPIAIDPLNLDQIKFVLGVAQCPLYVGATMSQASVEGVGGVFWRTDDGDQTNVGGHCFVESGFITGAGESFGQPNLSAESWAMDFYLTWAWHTARVDEAYVCVDLDRPPTGFNLETLRADISALQGGESKV